NSTTDTTGSGPVIRTAKAAAGRLEESIRLSGSTSAENFVSLVTPQMRGSRSGAGQNSTAITATFAGGTATPVTSKSGGNTVAGGSSSALSPALAASTSRTGASSAARPSSSSSAPATPA